MPSSKRIQRVDNENVEISGNFTMLVGVVQDDNVDF